MTTWILIVTIWFNGAMNSYTEYFSSESSCKAAISEITVVWDSLDRYRTNEMNIFPSNPYYPPAVVVAVCVEDGWEEDYD